MDFNDNARLDPSQVNVGGGRSGGGVALGGGLGLIVMILALIFGFNPGDILGQAGNDTGAQPGTEGTSNAQCQTGADIKKDPNCRWVAYTNSINDYWATQFQSGQYRPASTNLFKGSIQTACGSATSEVGPFYCPGDQKVYLDDDFFQVLSQRLGAEGGYAAEAYVVAHEYGHHISNLTGVMGKVQQQGQSTGVTSPAVRLELQADCYAGTWLRHAADDPNGIISNITQDDLNRAADAAASVGDDRIQKQATGTVSPESWTHGSSKMRHHWLAVGFNSGDPQQCDTFATNDLGQ